MASSLAASDARFLVRRWERRRRIIHQMSMKIAAKPRAPPTLATTVVRLRLIPLFEVEESPVAPGAGSPVEVVEDCRIVVVGITVLSMVLVRIVEDAVSVKGQAGLSVDSVATADEAGTDSVATVEEAGSGTTVCVVTGIVVEVLEVLDEIVVCE